MITPLTERIFVFISSALRQKNSVMLRCIPQHTAASDVVQEFASLCNVPFKSFQCREDVSLSSLTQLLNGVSMASVWVFFEHLDRLPLAVLSVLLKEIQLI